MKTPRLAMLLLATLSLCAPLSAKTIKGAEMFGSETFKYGRFEARMQMAASPGIVSSMFTYYNDSYVGGAEPWREIDIEILGKNPASFQSNIITRAPNSTTTKKTTSEVHHGVAPAANAIYHTYAIEWTPDSVAWYLDGVQVHCSKSDTSKQVVDLRDKEQNLRFNLWVSNSVTWAGAFDPGALPKHQFINWVKVYRYTPGAGENNSNYTLAWQDDFDTFDDARWGKGDWTFAESLADLIPENINVQDGTLIISLTAENAPTGFSGTVPPDDGTLATIRPPFLPSQTPASLSSLTRPVDLLGRTAGTIPLK